MSYFEFDLYQYLIKLKLYNDNQEYNQKKDIKQYLGKAMKTLVIKDDIVKLKEVIDYSNLMKDLTSKITTLKQKASSSDLSIMKIIK